MYVHYYKLANFVVQIYIFADTFFGGGSAWNIKHKDMFKKISCSDDIFIHLSL